MKRLFLLILFAAISFSAVSCGSTVQSMDESKDSFLSEASSEEPALAEEITEEPTTEAPSTEAPTIPLEMPSEDYELPNSCELKVENIMQKPELPTGCEVTALCIVLNYFGFDIDKERLFDEFMPHTSNADCTFDDKYVGNPRADNGFGCNAPVVEKTAKNYIEYEDSDIQVKNLTGASINELFYQIEQGRPVVVWASVGMKDVEFKLRWKTPDGSEAWFATLEHCMVLTGYDIDKDIVYIADPLKGNTSYSLERFASVYKQMGCQAVILYGDLSINSMYVDKDESGANIMNEEQYGSDGNVNYLEEIE